MSIHDNSKVSFSADELENVLISTVDYPNEQKEQHKSKFEKWLSKKYPPTESNEIDNDKNINTSYVMRRAEYDFICDILNGVKKIENHNKRHSFKKKKYVLVNGNVCRNIVNLKTNKIEQFKLVYLEEFFDILFDSHCVKRMHPGITKTYEFIQSEYIGLPKIVVAAFNELCYICDLKKKRVLKPRTNPKETNEILGQVQINMIKITNINNDEYKWIGNIEDHIGNMHSIWTQKKKEGKKF